MKILGSLSVIILSFFLFQGCSSQGEGSKEKADSINETKEAMPQDAAEFMVDAAMINMAEITLGTIAKEQAATSRVRDLASMIVNDHKKAKRKLKDLAEQTGIALPHSLNDKYRDDSASLDNKEGMTLDQVFLSDMVTGHEDAIDRFEEAKNNIAAADVRTYITKMLPTLQEHLDSAEAIQSYMQGMSEDMRQ